MSGILGQLLQGVMSGSGGPQGQSSPLASILQQVMAVREGDKQGVAAIIAKFQNAGLGTQVQSWVGTGQNASITPDAVSGVFSQDQINGWAQQAGTTPDALRNVLAEALPHVVDHFTPNGQMPDAASSRMPDLSGLLGRLLGATGNQR
jgi:uncharacterized protein YidB (DUF937 family)